MPQQPSNDVTLCLQRLQAGDTMARDQLFEHIYEDLKALSRKFFRPQAQDQTLQPTALVHEAYLRLVGSDARSFEDRRHFFRVAALAMRQLITDRARARVAVKRGGEVKNVNIEPSHLGVASANAIDLLTLDEALVELASLDERQCRIVELRFLAGLTVDETAETLDISPRTVALDWKVAKSFLASRLSGERQDEA